MDRKLFLVIDTKEHKINALLNNDNPPYDSTHSFSRERSNHMEKGLASLAGWLADPKMSELPSARNSTRK